MVVGFHRSGLRLLVEHLALHLDARVHQLGLAGLQGRLGVERVALELRVRHFENHRVRLHEGTRLKKETLDAAFGCGRKHPNPRRLDDERARAAHLAHHRAALDRVHPDRRLFDGRRGGFQAREAERDQQDRSGAGGRHDDPLLPFLLGDVLADDVHGQRARREPCQRGCGLNI